MAEMELEKQETEIGALLEVLAIPNTGRIPKKLLENSEFTTEDLTKTIEVDDNILGEEICISELRAEKNKEENGRSVYISKFESGLDVEVVEEDTYLIQSVKEIEIVGEEIETEEKLAGVEFAYQIPFQKGSIKTNGRNGVMIEELLEVVLDRLSVLNDKFQCKENEVAIFHIYEALDALDNRTRDRIARQVEGIHTK